MKYIVSAILLLSMVGCSTTGYRGPASQPKSDIDRYEQHFQKYERLGN